MIGYGRDDPPRRTMVLADAGDRLPRRPGGWMLRLFNVLLEWQDRAVQRRHLASLDDRMLKDIGLDRADVIRETYKPFWRP